MSKRDLKLKLDELSSVIGTFKGLDIEVGRIFDEEWEAPMEPTLFPNVATLRNWDRKPLERYMPFCDFCCLCTFMTISYLTAGGRRVDGFHGLSIEYMRSLKFLEADGGWDRIVWMPQEIKERIQDFLPPEIVPTIATEFDVADLDQLKSWLTEKNHPIVKRWSEELGFAPAKTGEIIVPTLELPASAIPLQGIPSGMSFTILLKNAKIKAEKMIINANKGR